MQPALAIIDPPAWFPDWSGEIAAIVGGGESTTQEAVDKLKGRCRVIVVNNAYQLAPWADALYAADRMWWEHHKAARDFAGVKITPDAATAKAFKLNLIELRDSTCSDAARIEIATPGLISHGGNGGFQAINLATQFGAKRQIWLGLDFVGEHWHGPHVLPLKNCRPQTLEKWGKWLDLQAPILAGMGVEVINASPTSALTKYPKMDIDAAFARWQ